MPLPTVREWILVVWHSVSPEILQGSFKVTGMSNEIGDNGDFMINDIDNESESNVNDNDSIIGNCSERHQCVGELLTEDAM